MKIRHTKIERFRGIRDLDWRVGGEFVCLVGPGDATKTTILDAVEFALSPWGNIPFDDSDFCDATVIGQTRRPPRLAGHRPRNTRHPLAGGRDMSEHQIVRFSISSIFRDMHAERDHLFTFVFPELRERVEQLVQELGGTLSHP